VTIMDGVTLRKCSADLAMCQQRNDS